MTDSRVKTELDQKPKQELNLPDTSHERKGSTLFWDLFLNFVFIFGLVILIRTFLISPFHVYGASMCNTINFIDGECRSGYGEYNIVNKLTYLRFGNIELGSPDRGDIVVFRPPETVSNSGTSREFFIKRVIGLPGDTVVLKNGNVYLRDEDGNDVLQSETYLKDDVQGKTLVSGSRDEFVYQVPVDKYFVLGDNRTRSTDSRACFGTVSSSNCRPDSEAVFLPRSEISGKAWLTLWPLEKLRFIDHEGQ